MFAIAAGISRKWFKNVENAIRIFGILFGFPVIYHHVSGILGTPESEFRSSQVPKFLKLQVPKIPSFEVSKFRGSQVPKFLELQVPKFPELQFLSSRNFK